ncbi:hypothetical protein D0Z03_000061 [Geotrichum reessii]|nr:hypothetical protein D0Z03_000061 [Galactomyces reessii]
MTASAPSLHGASITPSIRISASGASTPAGTTAGLSGHRQTATSRRNALREFYKLAQAQQDQVTTESSSESSVVDPSDTQQQTKNKEEQEVSLETLVQRSDLKELLRHENRLALEIRELDSEGKALVYNNYSKLTKASAVLAGIVSIDADELGDRAKTAAAAAAVAASVEDNNIVDTEANDEAVLEKTRQWVRTHAVAETKALVAAGDRTRAEELVQKTRGLLSSDRFVPANSAVQWKDTILTELEAALATSSENVQSI